MDVKTAQITYYAKRAASYEQEDHHLVMFRPEGNSQKRIASVLSKLSQENGESLLDVACGTGNILRTAVKYFRHTVGIDLSIDMATIAKGQGLKVVNADSDLIPFKSDSFSVLTCYSSLHHMDAWEDFFREAYRVLRNGGTLYTDWDPHGPEVRHPALVNIAERAIGYLRRKKSPQELKNLEGVVERYHSYSCGFSADIMKGLLQRAGFRDIAVHYHNDTPDLIPHELRAKDYIIHILRYLLFLKVPTFRHDDIMTYFSLIARK